VSNVLVEHDTGEDFALLKETTWNLLDLGVSLDINLNEISLLAVDGLDGLDSEINDEVAPLGCELGANARADDLLQILLIFNVNRFLLSR
jgi:hypothetical protein